MEQLCSIVLLDQTLEAFSSMCVPSLLLLLVKSDLLWFDHNCYLSHMFRFNRGYFVDSDRMLPLARFDLCD
jgi:hypothetical protein